MSTIYLLTGNKPELKELMHALLNKVANKWKFIGMYLGIPMGTLNTLEVKCRNDPNQCLMEMLGSIWLQRVNPPPTWDAIIQAIEFLGDEQLASDMRSHYCH